MSKINEPVAWGIWDNQSDSWDFIADYYEAAQEHINQRVEDCLDLGIVTSFTAKPLYAIPEGFCIVPIEPNTVMDNEGVIALHKEGYGTTQKDARECYKAMIKSYLEE
jgi:hypothetical protein